STAVCGAVEAAENSEETGKENIASDVPEKEAGQEEIVQEGKGEVEASTAICGAVTSDQVRQTFPTACQAQSVDIVGRMMSDYAPWLCKWACPNRWWIRIAWDSLLLFFTVYILLAFYYPALEEFCGKYQCLFWFLGGITAGLIYISFACDPVYRDKTTDFLVYMFIVLVIGIAFSVRKRDYP
ncbi:MAG: hypothetical protein D3924_18445, partial [Candidatus Electrothrix sp. AR4]|nr:hypothetical protein [Candidatus Electrothrix sp. AR4]